MNAYQVFQKTAEAVISSGSTPKAKEFAQTLVSKIEAKGEAWIESNFTKLGLFSDFESLEKNAPVADNRIFYIKKWQLALV